MQNATCKPRVVCDSGVRVAAIFTPFPRTRIRFASCILHFALLAAAAGCAKAPPAIITPPTVDNTRQLQADLVAATKLPGVQRATWGVAVQSLARNERLFDLNPQTLMVPASVAKLVSVASAADAVGWDYRFTTTLRAGGAVDGPVLRGDLLVVGSGDDSYEEPRPGFAWSWDDLGYSTGAIFGALNLAENRLAVTVTPGAVAGAPTSLAFNVEAQDLPITNRSVTGAPGSTTLVWPEMRPGETVLTIAGSVPVGGMPATLGVSAGNPTAWFARVLRRRLMASGIEVSGPAVDGDDVSVPSPDAAMIL